MKSGKASRSYRKHFRLSWIEPKRKTGRRSRSLFVLLLIAGSFLSFSCRRPATPPPPPPPEAAAPPPPPPAPAVTLTASPASIQQGESTTLEWTARNANAVRIEPGVGAVATSGTNSVSPNSSVTYTATATGPGGTSTDTARVTVTAAAAPPVAPLVPGTSTSVEDLFNSSVQPIYFDYDQSEIRPDQVGPLQNNVRFLVQNSNLQFTLSGHADERGSQEYNIGLGDRRANAVRQYLINQGIAAARINTVSFGEDRPVCNETTEACYQRNRRAEFTLR